MAIIHLLNPDPARASAVTILRASAVTIFRASAVAIIRVSAVAINIHLSAAD
jgi:hypothetical protein